MTTETNRVCLAWPWYAGPDEHTYTRYMEVCHYFGRMQERSLWLASLEGHYPFPDTWEPRETLPPLDRVQADGDRAEITTDDGVFDFGYTDEAGLSLPGRARERCVENAQANGYDWIFMWDDDMLFPWSAFLRLWRHQKPVVAALAFTARDPILPVIYRWEQGHNEKGPSWVSKTVLDYPKDTLMSDEDVGGVLAFGAGVLLIHMNVFKQIPKPWFDSTGCGEDLMFCLRCHLHGIPRYVDTSLKTLHKKFDPQFNGEVEYEAMRREHPEVYAKLVEGGEAC